VSTLNISAQSDEVKEGHKQVGLTGPEFCAEQSVQERKSELFFSQNPPSVQNKTLFSFENAKNRFQVHYN